MCAHLMADEEGPVETPGDQGSDVVDASAEVDGGGAGGMEDEEGEEEVVSVDLQDTRKGGEEEGVPWHLCPLCRRPFEDPRVLACLHAFCAACLRRLLLPQLCAAPCEDEEGVEEVEMVEDGGGSPPPPSTQGSVPEAGSRALESAALALRSWASFRGSPRSVRKRLQAADEEEDTSKTRESTPPRTLSLQRSLTVARAPSPPPATRRAGSLKAPWRKRGSSSDCGSSGALLLPLLLRCPTCGADTEVPTPAGARRLSPQAAAGAVANAIAASLPPHYVLLHRLHGRKAVPSTKCDLCSLDASIKCRECSLALCALCSEAHRRQRSTADHTLEWGRGGGGRSPLPKAPPCPAHPGNSLRLYCSSCARLACRYCACANAHRCEPVAHAARSFAAPAIRAALQKARPHADRSVAAVQVLRRAEELVQARASEVEAEVDTFVDSWVRALEEHRRALQAEARRARDAKVAALRGRRSAVERQGEGVETAVRFADDLLSEASDAELLAVAGALVRRLEWCRARAEACKAPCEDPPTVSLQFLRAERAGIIEEHQMYGVVTAQAVCPNKCRISPEGLSNCRQHRKTEAVVVTRDADDQPIGHGGEQVTADLRYRDASHRQLPVHVSDQKDGRYIIAFIPDAAGVLSLTVTVKGMHIQGSPFTVLARTIRAHTGIFHCCTFCSSHGNKDASCACAGKMPGGYKGCGHGHAGHPGRRHWSCCGNVLEGSECGRSNGVFPYTIACLIPKALGLAKSESASCCIAVDSGAFSTSVSIVVDERVVAVKDIPVGGWHLSKELHSSLVARGCISPSRVGCAHRCSPEGKAQSRQRSFDAPPQVPVVSFDEASVKSMCRLAPFLHSKKPAMIPSQTLTVYLNTACSHNECSKDLVEVCLRNEFTTGPEIHFAALNLPQVIRDLTNGLPRDLRRRCLSNILLSGGNSSLNGLVTRLGCELRSILPEFCESINVILPFGPSELHTVMGASLMEFNYSRPLQYADNQDLQLYCSRDQEENCDQPFWLLKGDAVCSKSRHLPRTHCRGEPYWLTREEFISFGPGF